MNVHPLLMRIYAYVMQQIDSSSCDVFTIVYGTNIAFGFHLEQSCYILSQMQTHLWKSINNICIFPFPSIQTQKLTTPIKLILNSSY